MNDQRESRRSSVGAICSWSDRPIVRRTATRFAAIAPLLAAFLCVMIFAVAAPTLIGLGFVDYTYLDNGDLQAAQQHTLDWVKELNSYLISSSTLIIGGVGWYLTNYSSAMRPRLVRSLFFCAVGLTFLASWYGFRVYTQVVTELSQDALALTPGHSRILMFLELEGAACGMGAILLVSLFADAVTRRRIRHAA